MSEEIWWLGRAGVASALLGLGALMLGAFGSTDSPGRVVLRARVCELDRKLRLLRVRIGGRELLLVQTGGVVLALTLAMVIQVWLVAVLAPLLMVLPDLAIGHATSKRAERLCDQLEGWLSVLANALRGAASLGEAVSESVGLVSEPLRSEVELVVKEFGLGLPLDTALDNLAIRVGAETVTSAVAALRVARRSGGDLPRMLETTAETLRELARLESVVRTKTAEGRAQTWVISCVPFAMLVVVDRLHPGYFAPLTSNFVGNLLLVAAGILWCGALLAARKILQVDI